MTRFWISVTELFITMNSFTVTERNKNQWIYQWICDIQIIWKLSYLMLLRIIVFEHWTILIAFLFLVLTISIWLTIKPNNLRKFYSQISEKHYGSSYLCGRGPIKSVLFICPSVCLSIHLWHIFFRIYSVDLFIFLHEDILPCILKRGIFDILMRAALLFVP